MRLRFTVLGAALSALALMAVPAAAGAAPQHNNGLTIHAVPREIIAGETVLIFGRLHGADHAGQVIRLYHRINPNQQFSLISKTVTNAAGQYEFVRPDGIVMTNRSWFVRGPGLTHSQTVHELVAAEVSLAASSTNGTTRHPLVFSGHVTPNHAGSLVLLQEQKNSGNGWTTIGHTRVGPDSNYEIAHGWRVPGSYDVRVLFTGDPRNIAAPSDPVTVLIQQTEIPDFTIQTSDPIVTPSEPYTISGTLSQPGGTTPLGSTSVSLFARRVGGGPFREVSSASTGSDGSYSFANLESTTNELYQVRTTFAPHRHSAVLFEGVQDVVSMTASSMSSTVDGTITFSGNVSPDKVGHAIYLQKQGSDGDWHTVEVRFVNASSNFQFGWTFGAAGTKVFRARITGGPANVGAASAPVTIAVTQPPLSSLPTG